LYKNKSLPFSVFYQQQKQAEVVSSKSIDLALRNASYAHKPAPDHPWRRPWKDKKVPSDGDILTLSK
jgi:hypothetical protein